MTILVGKYTEYVEVPYVTGDTERTATRTLERAGFKVRVRYEDVYDDGEDGDVIMCEEEGTEMEKGSTVTIYVGRYREEDY